MVTRAEAEPVIRHLARAWYERPDIDADVRSDTLPPAADPRCPMLNIALSSVWASLSSYEWLFIPIERVERLSN